MPRVQYIPSSPDTRSQSLGRGIAAAGQTLGAGIRDAALLEQRGKERQAEDQEREKKEKERDIGRLVNVLNGAGSEKEIEILRLLAKRVGLDQVPVIQQAFDAKVGVNYDQSHITNTRRLTKEFMQGMAKRGGGDLLDIFTAPDELRVTIGNFTDRLTKQYGNNDPVLIGEIRQEIENALRSFVGDNNFNAAFPENAPGQSQPFLGVPRGGTDDQLPFNPSSVQSPDPVDFGETGVTSAFAEGQPIVDEQFMAGSGDRRKYSPSPGGPVFTESMGAFAEGQPIPLAAEQFMTGSGETGVTPDWYRMLKNRPIFSKETMSRIDKLRGLGKSWDEVQDMLRVHMPPHYKIIQELRPGPKFGQN